MRCRMREPPYNLGRVPRHIDGSCVVRLGSKDREEWLQNLSEFLLLCNAAARDRAHRNKGDAVHHTANSHAKPLSLEYLSDRLHVDDPIYGYVLRRQDTGHLQGFIALTPFTTWNFWFKWDSLAPEVGICLEKNCQEKGNDARDLQRKNVEDCSGAFSKALSHQIHDGHPAGEGVVWPHIMEVSLLGARGCGRFLLQAVIEELETDGRFDWIVVHATFNSISFYELLGFVRVGAVARYSDHKEYPRPSAEQEKEQISLGFPDANGRISSPFIEYTVKSKRGESLQNIFDRSSKSTDANIRDIIFFNRERFPQLAPSSHLKRGSKLRIPIYDASLGEKSQKTLHEVSAPKSTGRGSGCGWYVAKDNDVVGKVARSLKVEVGALIAANAMRYRGIDAVSRLRAGTKLRIPKVEIPSGAATTDGSTTSEDRSMSSTPLSFERHSCLEDEQEDVVAHRIGLGPPVAYRHWTFPNADVEDTEPSYMMARPLRWREMERRKQRLQAQSSKRGGDNNNEGGDIRKWKPQNAKRERQRTMEKLSVLGKPKTYVLPEKWCAKHEDMMLPLLSRMESSTLSPTLAEFKSKLIDNVDLPLPFPMHVTDEEPKGCGNGKRRCRVRVVSSELQRLQDEAEAKASKTAAIAAAAASSMIIKRDKRKHAKTSTIVYRRTSARNRSITKAAAAAAAAATRRIVAPDPNRVAIAALSAPLKKGTWRKRRPRRAVSAFYHFINHELRKRRKIDTKGIKECYKAGLLPHKNGSTLKSPSDDSISASETLKKRKKAWAKLTKNAQSKFRHQARRDADRYEREMKVYWEEKKEWEKRNKEMEGNKKAMALEQKRWKKEQEKYTNKVVKVKGEEGLYFVRTYVPDLHWAHLNPLLLDGTFPTDHVFHACRGKPRFVVAGSSSERCHEEMDVSADRIEIIPAIPIRRKEEFLIK